MHCDCLSFREAGWGKLIVFANCVLLPLLLVVGVLPQSESQ